MSVKITVNITYECAGPNCVTSVATRALAQEVIAALTTGESEELEKLEPANLPIGWIHVLANPVGATGVERWNFCSTACLADSLDRFTPGGVGHMAGR